MQRDERVVCASVAALKALWDRWDFQHQQGQEDIHQLANCCRKLLLKKNEEELEQQRVTMKESWTSLLKHLDLMQKICSQVNQERYNLISYNDELCTATKCSQNPIFTGIPLSLYLTYIDQIATRFRQELLTKNLIVEEIQKTIAYHVDGIKQSDIHSLFLISSSMPDINWEIQISLWASQVYLNTSLSNQLFSMFDKDMVNHNPESILR